MKRLPHPRRLYSFALYTAAAVVIALAVLLSLARLLLPSMEDYRAVVEDWASSFLEQPVTISGMDARLTGFSPSLELTGIALLSATTTRPMVHAESLRVDIDVPASLKSGQLVLGPLVITGADLAIERDREGILHVTGAQRRDGQGPRDADSFGAWLLAQPRVTVLDSRLEWREPDRPAYQFEDIEFELDNDGERHRLNASLQLPEELGTRMAVSLDMSGDILRPEQWSGQLFGRIEGVHPAPWLAIADFPGLQLSDGSVDASIWSEWRGGSLQSLEGEAKGRRLVAVSGSKSIRWEELGGRFRWLRNDHGWHASLGELTAVRDGKSWPAARLELSREGETTRLAADFLRLEDAERLLTFVPGLADEQRDLIAGLKPEGDLLNLRVERSNGRITGQMRFKDLGIEPWERSPGFRGLDGELYVDQAGIRFELATEQAEVIAPRLFRESLPIASLRGHVLVGRTDAGWQVQGQQLVFTNEDLEGEAQLEVQLPDGGGSPYIDLRSRFRNGRGVSVPRYLPAHIMPTPAVRWLDQAFRRGRITEGTALFRGRTSDFPFRKREGRFEVRFEAEEVELAFRDEWPHLHDVEVEVVFDGTQMLLHSSQARFLDSQVARCRVEIPDLRRSRLLVDGVAAGPLSDVLRTLRETPLAERIGEGALADFRAEGKSRLALRLEVPLSSRKQPPLSAAGELQLRGSRFAVDERLVFGKLDGTLHFDNSDFRAEAIQGRLFEYPVQFSVATEDGRTTITGVGRAGAKALGELEIPFADALIGETDWKANLVLPHDRSGGARLQIHSDFKGLTSHLPEPFDKVKGESRPFQLTRYLSGTRSGELSVAYGSRFQAAVALDSRGGLDRASLHFGTGMPDLPDTRRIRLTGELAGVVPQAWRRLLPAKDGGKGSEPALPIEVAMKRLQLTPFESGEGESPTTRPVEFPRMDVHVQRLEFDDAVLGELRFHAEPRLGRVHFTEVGLRNGSFRIVGDGQWQRSTNRTRFDLQLKAPDLGRMMDDLDFVSVIKKGKTRAEGHLEWEGSPSQFALDRLYGTLRVDIRKGTIEDVDPGSGRLLGLFSLSALPKRLRLDFSDVFRKGLDFDRIDGDLRLYGGDILTENLAVDSASAQMVMSGRTGLVKRDYDMLVSVVPNVSDSLAVAGGLALGPQAGAIIWVLQKVFHSQIDKATMFQYMVKGPWSAPVMERLPGTDAG
ncbi:YhdP family phospholipid transporter [Thiohalomonas denitrificans]|uniref:TIGR02099 family protein n=1 Tax=Thiohalomonas denitrificans TaxID=415747 RepID=A0A1G5PMI4_9GAMM|nr:DUF3971 domain-containing protein [Thiohalomonas denitrificans]SCZ50678.1 TIGR02099 family protein [Thiohalomonas denitrificans]